MIGMVFFSSMRRLKIPLWPAALLSAAFLTGYGIMTGMSVSTRRAVIMFLFLLADGSQGALRIPSLPSLRPRPRS